MGVSSYSLKVLKTQVLVIIIILFIFHSPLSISELGDALCSFGGLVTADERRVGGDVRAQLLHQLVQLRTCTSAHKGLMGAGRGLMEREKGKRIHSR